ncbi:MAG: alpha-E domain-containing protein, partial [Nitrospirae bacterium]|nr:alpha-E domain-containing protein [Nitrospirota bacterium]
MLSRTAESFFWIGRYFERAEYIARFTDVNYHLLLEFSNWEDQAQTWTEYLDANGELSLFESLYGQVSTRAVLEFLALNPQNPNSILNLVQLARVNSRGIQDQLSSEVWGHINDF